MTQDEVAEILVPQHARGHGDLFADGLVARGDDCFTHDVFALMLRIRSCGTRRPPAAAVRAYSWFAARSSPMMTLVIPASPFTTCLASTARDEARMIGQKAKAPTATMPSKLPRPNDRR